MRAAALISSASLEFRGRRVLWTVHVLAPTRSQQSCDPFTVLLRTRRHSQKRFLPCPVGRAHQSHTPALQRRLPLLCSATLPSFTRTVGEEKRYFPWKMHCSPSPVGNHSTRHSSQCGGVSAAARLRVQARVTPPQLLPWSLVWSGARGGVEMGTLPSFRDEVAWRARPSGWIGL